MTTLISLLLGEVNMLMPVRYSSPMPITPDIKCISDIDFVAELLSGTTTRTQEGEVDSSSVFLRVVYITGQETRDFSYQTTTCARKDFPQLEGAATRVFNFVFMRLQNT